MFPSARSARHILGFLALGLLAGCGGGRAGSSVTPPLGSSQAAQSQHKTLASTTAISPSSAQLLYVADGSNVTTLNLLNGAKIAPKIPVTPPNAGNATGIAVDQQGDIYVADEASVNSNSTLSGYNRQGGRLWTSAQSGSLGELFGVAVNSMNRKVYVATQAGTVNAFDAGTGKPTFPQSITVNTSPSTCCLAGVAVDANGTIYAVNSGAGTVTSYYADGTPISTPLISGLIAPLGIAVDGNGKIYVASGGLFGASPSVTTYNTTSGTPTTPTITAGLSGSDPWGVAVDAANNIYVANTANASCAPQGCGGTVTRYNPSGQLTSSIPTVSGDPFGIAVAPIAPNTCPNGPPATRNGGIAYPQYGDVVVYSSPQARPFTIGIGGPQFTYDTQHVGIVCRASGEVVTMIRSKWNGGAVYDSDPNGAPGPGGVPYTNWSIWRRGGLVVPLACTNQDCNGLNPNGYKAGLGLGLPPRYTYTTDTGALIYSCTFICVAPGRTGSTEPVSYEGEIYTGNIDSADTPNNILEVNCFGFVFGGSHKTDIDSNYLYGEDQVQEILHDNKYVQINTLDSLGQQHYNTSLGQVVSLY